MLPGFTLLNRLKLAGRDAAYHGSKVGDCPYSTKELADAWLKGWHLGFLDRTIDLKEDRHPDHPVRIVRK